MQHMHVSLVIPSLPYNNCPCDIGTVLTNFLYLLITALVDMSHCHPCLRGHTNQITWEDQMLLPQLVYQALIVWSHHFFHIPVFVDSTLKFAVVEML
jgi:hypothetical protein